MTPSFPTLRSSVLLVLILDDGHRRVAVPVSRVADIISHAVNIEQPAAMPGIAGLAMIDGQSIEIVDRSEEHTSELQSIMRISYAVFCLKKKKKQIISIIELHSK